jgi:hemoglobin-like flavoprotein
MTPEQLQLVQSSYARLGDAAPAMAVDFYARLFAADPSAEALFTDGPDVMSVKFANELEAIVEAISSFDTFASRVRELAARHVGYGVQSRHYHAVGEALIGALAAHLAPEWDDALEAAWGRAYNLVAEVMMAAAADVRARATAGRLSGDQLGPTG